MRIPALVFASLFGVTLYGCDLEDSWFGIGKPNNGRLTLGVTDAPADQLAKVVITFNGVIFQSESGERRRFDFDPPKQVDLLKQQGKRELLLDDVFLEAGRYRFIQLLISTGGNNSYVVLALDEASRFPLFLADDGEPFGVSADFTMPDRGKLDLTIDIDLRRGLDGAPSVGSFSIRPAMRLVDTDASGTIAGAVAARLLRSDCARREGRFVYIFAGHVAEASDMRRGGVGPLVTAPMTQAAAGSDASYRAAFLPAGRYTLAYTCQGDVDQPLTEERIPFSPLINATVAAGAATTANFTR
ncbi:MAG TPA: DUF4382 domain-containing protein [Gammaproteobacteria bacterium]|nr:DUF4382 domain-containing protein [Gammaproteobacteria bacterium]